MLCAGVSGAKHPCFPIAAVAENLVFGLGGLMVGAMSPVAESLARRYDAVRPHLTERKRWV